MKYIILVTLLFSSNCFADLQATVQDNTISWPDTGGWMQVQNESTFNTVENCEGFITSCVIGEGTYKLVDHSTGILQIGIKGGTSTETLIERVTCDFSNMFVFQGKCEVSCPTGMRIKRLVACNATINESGLLKATDFDSDTTTLFCRTASISVPTTMSVGVECE